MEIQYINVYIFSQIPGINILSEITLILFPFLDFLIKYYTSHSVEKSSDVYNIISLLSKYLV